jgi:hypothetical protein
LAGSTILYFFFAALPVPDSSTICGAPDASSLMVNAPVCSAVFVGLKVTSILQDLPGANVFMHCEPLIANGLGPAIVSPVTTTLIFELFGLMFLIATFLGLLLLPSIVLSPKFTEPGVIFNRPRMHQHRDESAAVEPLARQHNHQEREPGEYDGPEFRYPTSLRRD